MERKVKINRLFHNNASVRSHTVDKALMNHEDLFISCEENNEMMRVPYKDLIKKGTWSKNKFKSVHDGKYYHLVDYQWIPTSKQETLI